MIKKKKKKKKKFMMILYLFILTLIWVIIIYYIINIIKNITFINKKKIEIENMRIEYENKEKIKNELEIKKYNLSLDIDKYRRLILTDEFSIKLKEESITKLKEEIKKIQYQISS